tara:strand:+ start:9350 stop:10171 length:822 start_codon:yes stop_codon:yes gene_type:complete
MGYITHRVPKGGGGYRIIEEPDPELKQKQREALRELSQFIFPPHVTCAAGRGLLHNVGPHQGAYLILTMDIKDFFGSVRPGHSHVGIRSMGEEAVKWDNRNRPTMKMLCFKQGARPHWYLPQGAPTSPFMANAAALTMDKAIMSHLPPNMNYTRYMDDMTISVPDFEDMRPIIDLVTTSGKLTGLQINEKKTKILYRDREQVVTGITMNSMRQRPTIKRSRKRRLRAQLDQLARQGKMSPEVQGYLAFMKGVDPELHGKMMRYYQKRIEIHNT